MNPCVRTRSSGHPKRSDRLTESLKEESGYSDGGTLQEIISGQFITSSARDRGKPSDLPGFFTSKL